MKRSYYQNSIALFKTEETNSIFGRLVENHRFNLDELQKNAWLKQIEFLKTNLKDLKGYIYFEFSIPRMGKRVDNIIVTDQFIFILEFKVGDKYYAIDAQCQTIDYCLDLLNFHQGSHNKSVIPILIATNALDVENEFDKAMCLEKCIYCNKSNLGDILTSFISSQKCSEPIDVLTWEKSNYKPTPTIIEAAQALYRGHNVNDISRNDSGAINLSLTSKAINDIIDFSKAKCRKSICFLTGVPGAGKTLAGLNIANERTKGDQTEHAVFLSGNGPLVDVLREALTRDSMKTVIEKGSKLTRSKAERNAKTFIQNIHHFRDEYQKTDKAPIERVVVFDEAQRAWQKEQVSKFMKTKKGIDDFDMSEPEYLISVMDRHQDWCSIICLIGGGQEINTGEAGLTEWMESLKNHYPNWDIYYSEQIVKDKNVYLDDDELLKWLTVTGNEENDLHLNVSLRSFRSEKVSLLVQTILENKSEEAKNIFLSIKKDYPVYLTRNLEKAKEWLKNSVRGTERMGVLASSGARRLKANGIDVKNKITPTHWFLNDKFDVRSSHYLEDVATEFDIQGLEIDFACVAWDINLYYDNGCNYQSFKGTKWQNIKQTSTEKYLLNSYRVLLTRARQGLIIYVPEVNGLDPTRNKNKYDGVFNYLQKCGLIEL